MKRVKKRGQAAMEFLMTYGWALLVVLIAIGALAFFGVLNPAKFLPQACIFGPGFACEDFKITASDKIISLNVRNGLGRDLDTFFVYIDKKTYNGNEVCGGITGVVALPLTPPLDTLYPSFKDGSVRALTSERDGVLFDGGEEGINCDIASPYIVQNCCSTNGIGIAACQSATCVCADNGEGFNCALSSSPLPAKAGQRFNQDIVIVYRERGSSILHQRIGRMTTSTE